MTRLFSVVIDCSDPKTLSVFWASALGYSDVGWEHEPYVTLASEEGVKRPLLLLQRVAEPKSGKNRLHIDVYADDINAEADRLVALGATRLSEPVEEHGANWIVMADPESKEFCVCAGLTG